MLLLLLLLTPPATPTSMLRAAVLYMHPTKKRQSTKEWKFSVVESIMSCKERAVLGEELLDSFQNILKQGPFFVPAKRRDVATAE